MAAWLAFLKSRLLLPPDPAEEGPSGEELAAHLAFQLERLQAMREAAAQLMARDQLGRDFFARGLTEDVARVRQVRWTASLLDLMQAYARLRTRDEFRPFVMDRDAVMTMEQALERMRHLIGFAGDWTDIASYLPEGWTDRSGAAPVVHRRNFAACLELAKEGKVEMRQSETLRPDPDPPPRPRWLSRRAPHATLFEAPPMAEQERMVEAILFATRRAGDAGRTRRPDAAWLRAGRGAGASAQALRGARA